MRLALATDHRGFALKEALVKHLREAGHDVADLGCHGSDAVDYPDFALRLAERVAGGDCERGILICGTGIGMSIAANKVPGARAALVYDEESLRLSREHNDANILVLPGNWLAEQTASRWVDQWLEIPFSAGRHAPRIDKIAAYDRERSAAPESRP